MQNIGSKDVTRERYICRVSLRYSKVGVSIGLKGWRGVVTKVFIHVNYSEANGVIVENHARNGSIDHIKNLVLHSLGLQAL